MRTSEFFYWLQGYFEISGTTEPLTGDQIALILRHLDLVNPATGTSAERLLKMRTLFDLAVEGSMSLAVVTTKIRHEVSEQFIHVIDPAAGPAVQKHLNTVHNGGGGGLAMRC